MLIEDLLLHIPEAQLLQTNTDGATLRFPKEYLDKYNEICKAWEKLTNLTLEFADYKAMYIWDVNNYFAIYTNGKNKCKGRFEWEDQQNKKPSHLHKNKSFLIIPKAIFNYFVNGISPEEYIAANRNIFDYCGCVRLREEDWCFEQTTTTYPLVRTRLQDINRYFISKKGCKMIKLNTVDKREVQVHSGPWYQTLFNRSYQASWEEYNVNVDYYLKEIHKEIDNVLGKNAQLQLEFE